jgi:TldD protein
LEARPAPVGELPVVLSPQAAGLFLHETLGRALEGDLVASHMSFLANGLGRQIASSALTVGEEPPLGTHYDDEGTKLRKATLVENGVLISFLSGRKTSALLGVPNCGAAWRGSYRSLPSPLLRHMRVWAGKASLQQMLSKMELGLCVTRLGGGTFNAASGAFSFPVTEGFIVREGALGEPMKPAEISGNAAETLRQISVVGSKCERHPGVARKRDEAIMIWDSSPAVAFESMLVKPNNSPVERPAAFR